MPKLTTVILMLVALCRTKILESNAGNSIANALGRFFAALLNTRPLNRAGPVGSMIRRLLFRRWSNHAGHDNTLLDASEINIQIVQVDCKPTVIVTGRVTVDSSPHLRSALLELLNRGTRPDVVVDLSGVSYLDMSGLATLLEGLKAARQCAKTLRVRGMTGQTRMLAEIAELDKIFHAAGSEVEFP